jgi:hypothetical protein
MIATFSGLFIGGIECGLSIVIENGLVGCHFTDKVITPLNASILTISFLLNSGLTFFSKNSASSGHTL